jgi:choloylglycine hydrolase
VPPPHYVVHDESGKSIVIEYVEGKLHVYDNVIGVITNSPAFDWHITNLRNYLNFSPVNAPPVEVRGVKLTGFGQGHRDAGDAGRLHAAVALCPSRRLQHIGIAVQDGRRGGAPGVSHLVDIPEGSSREEHKDAHGNIMADHTFGRAPPI